MKHCSKGSVNSIKHWQVVIFILCWVAYACIYFGRVNLSVALPVIQTDLGYSKTQVGLIGSLFLWVYGFGQLINGNMGDRVSSKKLIFLGLLITALANILFGFASSILIMCILWIFNGYFQSMLWGPMSKTLSYWFEYEKRGKVAIGISTSMVGGYILAWGLAGVILAKTNWRCTFIVPGIIIMVYSLVWLKKSKDHPKEIGLSSPNDTLLENTKDSTKANLTLFQVICKTRLWFVVIACFVQGIIKEGIALWSPMLMKDMYNLDIESMLSFLMLIPLMNFVGMMLAGWLNKKLKNNEKIATAILFGAGLLMNFGFLFLGKLNVIIAVLFLSLSSGMMYGANSLLLGVIPLNFARYNKSSSVAGFLDFCSYVAAGVAAVVTGFISDQLGWNGVISFWAIGTFIGIIALIISYRYDKMDSKHNCKAVI